MSIKNLIADNMKYNIFKILASAFSALLVAGCADWVSPEPKDFGPSLVEPAKDDAYYAALRAYKESDHSVSFGWFSNWGEAGLNTSNMLQAIPDSMDIISLWSNYANISDAKKEDLKFVREVKGTKVVVTSFISHVGSLFPPADCPDEASREEYWGWVDGDEEAIMRSIEKWTKALSDTLYHYGYDGIDIDYEPGEYGGPLCRNSTYFTKFVTEMGKYIGPKSGTGRLFIIDGYYWQIPNPNELGVYFDYFVEQAYATTSSPTASTANSASNLETRLNNHGINVFSGIFTAEEFTNRYIVTENLESASDCLNGGFLWTDATGHRWDKSVMPCLVGFADWKPSNGFRKGGFGAYQFGYENANNPPYKWLRKAIQQQNPSPGYDVITIEDDK